MLVSLFIIFNRTRNICYFSSCLSLSNSSCMLSYSLFSFFYFYNIGTLSNNITLIIFKSVNNSNNSLPRLPNCVGLTSSYEFITLGNLYFILFFTQNLTFIIWNCDGFWFGHLLLSYFLCLLSSYWTMLKFLNLNNFCTLL